MFVVYRQVLKLVNSTVHSIHCVAVFSKESIQRGNY